MMMSAAARGKLFRRSRRWRVPPPVVAASCVVLLVALCAFAQHGAPASLPVILVHFDVSNSAHRSAAVRAQQARLGATDGVEVYTVELAFGDEPFTVTSPHDSRQLQLRWPRDAPPLWVKEGLINAGVARLLPASWTCFAAVDAEVLFENSAWARDAARALTQGGSDALQPFASIAFGGLSLESSAALASRVGVGGMYGLPAAFGFAWGWSRRAYEALGGGAGGAGGCSASSGGGLFECAVVGQGDLVVAYALYGEAMLPHGGSAAALFVGNSGISHVPLALLREMELYTEATHHLLKGMRVGFLPGAAIHEDHGTLAGRAYNLRFEALAGFDPRAHLIRSAGGLLVPSPAMPSSIATRIASFFAARSCDDAVGEGLAPEGEGVKGGCSHTLPALPPHLILPSDLVPSTELYDVRLPLPYLPCQRKVLPWDDRAHADAEAAIATPFTLVSPARLRATLALTLVALALPQGDLVETGVYTGGSAGLMLRALAAFDGCSRRLWVFDSFSGLPAAGPRDLAAATAPTFPRLPSEFRQPGVFSAGEELFRANLASMGALDGSRESERRLIVTSGYFNTTVRLSPIQNIAFLRLDGDLFESTWDPLVALYDKLVPGGYVFVDDYYAYAGCMEAVDTFRWQRRIAEPLRSVREEPGRWQLHASTVNAVYWRKQPYVEG